MLIERKHSNLIITDFSEEEDLQTLKHCCSLRYREKNAQGGYYTRNIDHYQLVDENTFLTSMAFLHRIKENFPDAEINIQEREKLPIVFRKNFILRDWQQNILSDFINNGRRLTVSAPTGSGKTYIALAAIFYLRLSTLIVVPKKEIQRNAWKKRLIEKLGISPNYIGYFDGEFKQIKPFTIAIYNSGYLHIDKLKDKFDFLIFDECHHCPAAKFKKIALFSDAYYRLGLSATPQRDDKNEELIYNAVGNLVQGPSFIKLQEKKEIAPIEHEKIFVDLLPEEREKYNNYLIKYKNAPRKKYNEHTKTKGWYLTRLQEIAHGSLAKIPMLTYIAFKHRRNKILVFTSFLNQAGLITKILKPFNARILVGKTNKQERNSAFDWFHKSKNAILVSIRSLDEGINIPDANIEIILSGWGKQRQQIQRIGRAVRYQLGKTAKIYEIISKGTMDESQSNRRQIIY